MEKQFASLKRLTIEELEIEDADLQAKMTVGFTASGTFLNLLKLDRVLKGLEPEIHVIYSSIRPYHLRVIRKEYWEEYSKWRKKQGLEEIQAEE